MMKIIIWMKHILAYSTSCIYIITLPLMLCSRSPMCSPSNSASPAVLTFITTTPAPHQRYRLCASSGAIALRFANSIPTIDRSKMNVRSFPPFGPSCKW